MDLHINDLSDSQTDSDEEDITPQSLMKNVEEAWINEKFAPEILPHKNDIVEMLLTQIQYIDNNLRHSEYDDFQKTIYQLEADRLRFMVTSYLRLRLEKIEKYVLSVVAKEEGRIQRKEEEYLTDAEFDFACSFEKGPFNLYLAINKFVVIWEQFIYSYIECEILNLFRFAALEEHFKSSLNPISNLIQDSWKREPLEPNMSSFVFFQSKKDVEGVGIDDDEGIVDLHQGTQMLASYRYISDLVKRGEVRLL